MNILRSFLLLLLSMSAAFAISTPVSNPTFQGQALSMLNMGGYGITNIGTNSAIYYLGSGAGLTNLNASSIASGVVSTNYLPATIAYTAATNTFTAPQIFNDSYVLIGTNASTGYGSLQVAGTEQIRGQYPTLQIENTQSGDGVVGFNLYDYNGTTNNKSWFIYNQAPLLKFVTANDAQGSQYNAMDLDRNGNLTNAGDISASSGFFGGVLNVSGKITGAVSTTSNATINLPPGVAPTSPVNGDLWTTTNGIYARVNGVTIGPLIGTNSIPGNIAYTNTANVFTQPNTFQEGFVATGSGVGISAAQSGFYATTQPTIVYSSGVTNQRIWDQIIYDSSGTLRFRAVNDNEGAANDWLESYRTGDTPTYAAFPYAISAGTNGWDSTSKVYVNGVATVNAPGNTNSGSQNPAALNVSGEEVVSAAYPAYAGTGFTIYISPIGGNDAGYPSILYGYGNGGNYAVVGLNGSVFTITDPDAENTEFAIYNDAGTGLITDGSFAYDRGSLVVGTNAQDGTTAALQVHGVTRIDVTGASPMLVVNDTSNAHGGYISLQVNGTEQGKITTDIYGDINLNAGGTASLSENNSNARISVNYYGRSLIGSSSIADDNTHTLQVGGTLSLSNSIYIINTSGGSNAILPSSTSGITNTLPSVSGTLLTGATNTIPIYALSTNGASSGQAITFNGTNWTNSTPSGSIASTNFPLSGNGSGGAIATATNAIPLTLLTNGSTNGQVVTYNGTNAVWASNISHIYVQTFTSSGTYTPHAGLIFADVRVWGGGGSGGTANPGSPAGGGAGGFAEKLYPASSIGSSQSVTIGAGGAALTTGPGTGNGGGTTTFGSSLNLYATGGGGGYGAGSGALITQPGAGGVGYNGDINGYGGNGQPGIGISGTSGRSGDGGTPFGGVGQGGLGLGNQVSSSSQTGNSGVGYAAGGSGGYSYSSGLAYSGAGTGGLCIVIEYCEQ